MRIILVYITNPNKTIAQEVARYLLNKRLIACANIFPVNSLYWWQGKITNDNEVILIAKTAVDKFNLVKKAVKKIHPYKVPCMIKIPAEVNKTYYQWLKKELI